MSETKRLPNLSKLSIAILESLTKPFIGDEGIKVIKEPLQEKELRDEISKALLKTEARFTNDYEDHDIGSAVLSLPFADLPTITTAARDFYENPSRPEFSRLINERLKEDLAKVEPDRIAKAVDAYVNILRQELASLSEEIRQKIMTLALLSIEKSIKDISESDRLFKLYREDTSVTRYIRTREFEALIKERTQDFVGRDYIFKAVDNLLEDKNFTSGYIVITGEPGIGKTAFMAQLVKRRGYVFHFNIAAQNIRHIQDFISNVCAQLIIRYKLNYDTLPDKSTRDTGFLLELLGEIADRQNRPVVVLIDAVDEAEDLDLPPNANRLFLPQVLPEGVFFVLTTRPKADYRIVVEQRRDIYLEDGDPDNLADVSQYIQNFIKLYPVEMESRITQWQVTKDEFSTVLTKKSEGNFMYLTYVLRDIRDGKLSPADLNNIHLLPQGLRAYYQQHWRLMKAQNPEKFEKNYQPVICILAAARESVTIDQVAEWTELTYMQVKNVMDDWREFLNVQTAKNEGTFFHLYHTSFQDFLRDEVGLKAYHGMIASNALKKIQ